MGNKAHAPIDVGQNWWRDIPGYGGKYRVSRGGDVQRVFPSGLVRDMTPYKKQGGAKRNRLFVKLTANGKPKGVPMLKVMAEAWHINCDPTLIPYHRNGDVTDNRADNIGFIDRSSLGKLTGHKTSRRKCVLKVTESGEAVEAYRSAREAAGANNMSYQTVLDRCHNKVRNPFALDGHTYQFEK